MFKIISNILSILLSNNRARSFNTATEIETAVHKENEINWTDPKCKVSEFFTVKECLWLPSWDRLANENDGLNDEIKKNIRNLADQMDIVRRWIGKPIIVHVWYRPPVYNKLIGGAPKSNHMKGIAVDFSIKGMSCDDFRNLVMKNGKLESWDMRMERLEGSNWVHLDIGMVKTNRYFKP